MLIQNADLKYGFNFENKQQLLLFWKWQYWKKGIPTREFNNEHIRDIRDVMELDNVIENKKMKDAEIQDMINKAKGGLW